MAGRAAAGADVVERRRVLVEREHDRGLAVGVGPRRVELLDHHDKGEQDGVDDADHGQDEAGHVVVRLERAELDIAADSIPPPGRAREQAR